MFITILFLESMPLQFILCPILIIWRDKDVKAPVYFLSCGYSNNRRFAENISKNVD